MAKDNNDLVKIIAILRKNGVSRLKNSEIEIELHPSALFPESAYKQKLKAKDPEYKDIPDTHSISQAEAALFWSSNPIVEGATQ